MTIELRRQDLYEQVWAKPMRALAREYGVSDVALKKHCTRLNIPVPGRGYWGQTRARGSRSSWSGQ